jgi:hypothetical protein
MNSTNKAPETGKATPRPWIANGNMIEEAGKPIFDSVVASTGFSKAGGRMDAQAKANAQLIVTAVNQFEALTRIAEIAAQFERNRGGLWADLKNALAALESIKGKAQG